MRLGHGRLVVLVGCFHGYIKGYRASLDTVGSAPLDSFVLVSIPTSKNTPENTVSYR
jgi:hypothetical protein